MTRILVISKKTDAFTAIQKALGGKYQIKRAPGINDAIDLLKNTPQEFVFVDLEQLKVSDETPDYAEALQRILNFSRYTEIIVMCSAENTREAVRAVKCGAGEYITYPVRQSEVRHVIDSIQDYNRIKYELNYLREKFWQTDTVELVPTSNAQMKIVFDKICLVAPTSASVLLGGETGTGKGILARLIHKNSNRKNNQFISMHCGAIPDTLLESELFGHEKGAFTGAIRRKLGKFEIAHGGTIFLDEIGTLTPSAQIKLLQVLQEGIFQRVGSEETRKVDVRVISATNVDLKKVCEEGQYRKDLYYRLNVFPIQIPSLSQRSEDIPQLAEFFLKRLDRRGKKGIQAIEPKAMESLKAYAWPGNIRELENSIEQAYILGSPYSLTMDCLPKEIIESVAKPAMIPVDINNSLADIRRKAIEIAEKSYLRELLARHQGIINKASADAGITTRQLHKLLSKYGIRKEEFRFSFNVTENPEV